MGAVSGVEVELVGMYATRRGAILGTSDLSRGATDRR
jgi:hypothetical protein